MAAAPGIPVPYPNLLNPRTGIIRRLESAHPPAHFPPSFAMTTARLSDTTRFSRWPSDPAGAGYAFADPAAMLGAAMGEAAERYCGNLVLPDLLEDSYTDLVRSGRSALDPQTVALYSPAQYASPGFPAVPLSRNLPQQWASGTDLTSGEETLVPASLVWPSYLSIADRAGSPRPGARPLTNPVIQAGLAAGTSPRAAIEAGLREVIERDAMTMSWFGAQGLHELQPPAWLTAFAAGPAARLSTRFFRLHQEFGIPVIGALVADDVTGYLSLGVGVNPDPITGALKAYAEALQLQLVLSDYDKPDGAFAAAAQEPSSPLKPWRADRRYGQSYRRDRADVTDYACHLQLHLDPQVQEQFQDELRRLTTGSGPLSPPPDQSGRLTTHDVPHPDLPARLTNAGLRILTVDVTTPDVLSSGIHVYRVLVPGLYSNAPIGLPFLGGQRLKQAAKRAVGPRPATPLPH